MRNAEQPNRKSQIKWIILIALALILYLVVLWPMMDKRECVRNLKAIQAAKVQFAQEAEVPDSHEPPMHYLRAGSRLLKHDLKCPSGGEYIVGKIRDPARCTITNRWAFKHILPGS